MKVLLLLCFFLLASSTVGYASIKIQENQTNSAIRIIVKKESMQSLLQRLHKTYNISSTINSKIANIKINANVYGENLLQAVKKLFRDYNLAIIQREDHSIQSLMILPAAKEGDSVLLASESLTIGSIDQKQRQFMTTWKKRVQRQMYGIRSNREDQKRIRQSHHYGAWR